MSKIVGIDASLSSTAACVIEDGVDTFHVFTTTKLDNKWMKHAELFATLHPVQYTKSKAQFSSLEVAKLEDYRRNAYEVVDTLELEEGDQVFMEGYAARAKGNIVDLVTFGTFLRSRIINTGAHLTIVTPMGLKKSWAELIYPKDAKGIARNYELRPNSKGEMLGIAGGSFQKHQMILGLYEMEGTSKFKKEMEMHRDDIMPLKNIPKPFDDCVDAYAAAVLGKERLI